MNTANAIGFFILGAFMQVIPLVSGASYGAADSQTLWLQFMSLITGSIGAGYLLRLAAQEVSVIAARIALRRAEARERQPQTARQGLSLGVRVRATF